MVVDPEKLAKLQKATVAKKVGGSRIKAKKGGKSEQDDTKLLEALGKLKATKIENIEEANFFQDNGKVLHFNRVGIQGAPASNTFAFTGYPQEKDITQLIPLILPQLGAENLDMLRKLAEQLQAGRQPDAAAAAATSFSQDADIPELIDEKFDEVD